MCDLSGFILDLYEYLTHVRHDRCKWKIIKKHTKDLQTAGDISFPLSAQCWTSALGRFDNRKNTILDVCTCKDISNTDDNNDDSSRVNTVLTNLITHSQNQWSMKIDRFVIRNNFVHLFLHRTEMFSACIEAVLNSNGTFGQLTESYNLHIESKDLPVDKSVAFEMHSSLHLLRLHVVDNVLRNLLAYTNNNQMESNSTTKPIEVVNLVLKSSKNNKEAKHILIAPILNSAGVKDTITTADQLLRKRQLDIQLMAQHRYGIQFNAIPQYTLLLEKLGRAAVIIEFLHSKPSKAIKLNLDDVSIVYKDASFIFYNCARLSTILHKFNVNVCSGIYPSLPTIDAIDFNLLNQPEEWELIYVYVVQFSEMIDSCVKDLKLGFANTHLLVAFLSAMSATFSRYYRRVKILTVSRQQLQAVLFARIYLLKSLQFIFYTGLRFMDIDPVLQL